MLPTPSFHHLRLSSADPDAAIGCYTRQFPATAKGTLAGLAALLSSNNVMVLTGGLVSRSADGGVTDLGAWIDKLRGEDISSVEHPYRLGETRAGRHWNRSRSVD
jgi:hypothetical protein